MCLKGTTKRKANFSHLVNHAKLNKEPESRFLVELALFVCRGVMLKDIEYTNSQMENIIQEHIHNSRDRVVLKLRFIDGLTQEKIAEEVDLSPRHISNIINKYSVTIIDCLKGH